jgi:hypothetical protein
MADPQIEAQVQEHGERAIKQLVYALEKSGLLFGRGYRRGRFYRTTENGRMILAQLGGEE